MNPTKPQVYWAIRRDNVSNGALKILSHASFIYERPANFSNNRKTFSVVVYGGVSYARAVKKSILANANGRDGCVIVGRFRILFTRAPRSVPNLLEFFRN